jgi:hypothetical protein
MWTPPRQVDEYDVALLWLEFEGLISIKDNLLWLEHPHNIGLGKANKKFYIFPMIHTNDMKLIHTHNILSFNFLKLFLISAYSENI